LKSPNSTILEGDSLQVLKGLPDNSFQCSVSSPPYWNLRNYQVDGQIGLEPTAREFIQNLVSVYSELKRVLHPSGIAWINIGDNYAGGGNKRGKGSPISSKQSSNAGCTGQLADVPIVEDLPRKNMNGMPWRFAFAMQDDGWVLRDAIIWQKKNPMPTSQKDRCTNCYEYIFQFTKGPKYFFDMESVREPARYGAGENFRSSSYLNDKSHNNSQDRSGSTEGGIPGKGGTRVPRNIRSWATQGYKGAHFACVDEETQCLTKEGWKSQDQIKPGDVAAQYNMESGLLSWAEVEDVARYDVSDQDMVSAECRDLSMLLTPNHRTIISRRRSRGKGHHPPTIIEAENLSDGHRIPVSADWDDGDHDQTMGGVEWAELIGWYVAEGYENKKSWSVDIYQSRSANPEKVERIRHLLDYVDAEYEETQSERKYKNRTCSMSSFRITGHAAIKIRSMVPGKRLSWSYMGLSAEEMRALVAGLIAGDGHIRPDDGRVCFIQKSDHCIDLVQAMAVRLGYAVKITKSPSTWRMYLTEKRYISLRGTNGSGRNISTKKYSGVVWCPKLPHGTWVARRNGRAFITGNTFPISLPLWCITASAPKAGVCAKCFTPYKRVVESIRRATRPGENTKIKMPDGWDTGEGGHGSFHREGREKGQYRDTAEIGNRDPQRHVTETTTVGWEPGCTCDCGTDFPAILDPFSGVATTGLACSRLRCHYVGIELNPEYAQMSRDRIKDDLIKGFDPNPHAVNLNLGTGIDLCQENVSQFNY